MSPQPISKLNEFLRAIGEPQNPGPDSIWVEWWDFHGTHPDINAHLWALTAQLLRQGWTRYAIKTLWELVRWHFQVEKALGAEFKLNNDFHSRYSRFIMYEHPEADGLFELRKIQTP